MGSYFSKVITAVTVGNTGMSRGREGEDILQLAEGRTVHRNEEWRGERLEREEGRRRVANVI